MRAEFCIRCGSQPSPFGKIKSIMPNGRAVPRATSIAPRAGGMTSEPSSADLIDFTAATLSPILRPWDARRAASGKERTRAS